MTVQASDQLTLCNGGASITFKAGEIHISSPTEIEFVSDALLMEGTQERG
jgi:hypothetical protein